MNVARLDEERLARAREEKALEEGQPRPKYGARRRRAMDTDSSRERDRRGRTGSKERSDSDDSRRKQPGEKRRLAQELDLDAAHGIIKREDPLYRAEYS